MIFKRALLLFALLSLSSAPCLGMEDTQGSNGPKSLSLTNMVYYGGIGCLGAFGTYCIYRYYNGITKEEYDKRSKKFEEETKRRLDAARDFVGTEFGHVEKGLATGVHQPLCQLNSMLDSTGKKMSEQQGSQLKSIGFTMCGEARVRRAGTRQYHDARGGLLRLLDLAPLETLDGSVTAFSVQLAQDEANVVDGLTTLNTGMNRLVKTSLAQLHQRIQDCDRRLLELGNKLDVRRSQEINDDQVSAWVQEYEQIEAEKNALLTRINSIQVNPNGDAQEEESCAEGAAGYSQKHNE